MRSASLIIPLAATLAAAAEVKRITAKEDIRFDPNTVTANVGDIIEFVFEPKNHSVVMGEFNVANGPCVPPNDRSKGFFSGFFPTASGTNSKVFRVTVNDTEPIVFYCAQGNHCSQGMVGIINPKGEQTRDAYATLAKGRSQAVVPPSVYGGVVADASSNPGPSGTASGNRETGTPGAAASNNAAVAAIVGVAGLAAFFA